MDQINTKIINKRYKIIIKTLFILLSIYLLRDFYLSVSNQNLPPKNIKIKDIALRGSIITSDGYTISRSIKRYSVSIHTAYLDPNKKEFFLKLFSIYTNIPVEELRKRFFYDNGKAKKGWITIASDIDAKTAIFLKDLKHKLNRYKVFRPVGVNKNFYYGLTITQKGESREYPLGETLSPILGYTREKVKDGYTYIVGYNGIEKYYEKYLNKKTDGYIESKRDAVGYAVYTRDTKEIKKKNGYSLHLNISLSLQKHLDLILDKYKKELEAKDIVAAVMQSKDSKVIAITSSNRYDPLHIKQDEIANLQPKMTTYAYEPGSVLKPITYSLALDNNLVTPQTIIPTYNGKMSLGRFRISDDEPFASLSVNDIIVHSSNIGISQVAWKLGAKKFRDGLINFGLGKQKSGLDIGTESYGKIYPLKKMKNRVNLSTTSYGYGIRATFAQLLKAYNVFNNNGFSKPPRVANYLQNSEDKKLIYTKDYKAIHPISADTANKVRETLRDVVLRGTGKAANVKGLFIAGKTGTAMIYKNGSYGKHYHTSFFGFANDDQGNRYTIGVLVVEPKYSKHFASQSAAPIFKEIVKALIDTKRLKPTYSQEEIDRQNRLKEQKEQEIQQQKAQRAKEFKDMLRRKREQLIKEKHKRKPKTVIPKPRRTKPAQAPQPDLF